MSAQYPLPLPHREAMGANDFMVTPSNHEAVAWIDQWPGWPSHCLILYGPAGAGKTHLAHVWQAKSGGKILAAEDVRGADIRHITAETRFIAVDGADALSGDAAAEQNLFHLYNILRETNGALLFTASFPPAQWNIGLPDLRSRLLASPAVALNAADDELIAALLVKQFRDRQLDVSTDLVSFLLTRITRAPGAIRELVAALDTAALAEGRRVTVALARKVLAQDEPKPADNGQ